MYVCEWGEGRDGGVRIYLDQKISIQFYTGHTEEWTVCVEFFQNFQQLSAATFNLQID